MLECALCVEKPIARHPSSSSKTLTQKMPRHNQNNVPKTSKSMRTIRHMFPSFNPHKIPQTFLLSFPSSTSPSILEITSTLDTGLNLHKPSPLISPSLLNAVLHGDPSKLFSYAAFESTPNLPFGYKILSKIPTPYFNTISNSSPVTPLTPDTLPKHPDVTIFRDGNKPSFKNEEVTKHFIKQFTNLTELFMRPNLSSYLSSFYVNGKKYLHFDFALLYILTVTLNDDTILRNFNRLFYILILSDYPEFQSVAKEYIKEFDGCSVSEEVGRGFKRYCEERVEFEGFMEKFEGLEEEIMEMEEEENEDLLFSYPIFKKNVKEGEDEMMAAARILEEGGEALDEVKDFLLAVGD